MDPRGPFMPVNLSIKNVPDALAQALRDRAASHRRSLQQELLCLLEQSVGQEQASAAEPERRSVVGPTVDPEPDPATHTDWHLPANRPRKSLQEIAEKARRLFPEGTEDSTPILRQMRDAGLRGKA